MDNKSNIYYMTNNNHEKIKASLVIASYLDTLGFKNGQWEFNFNTSINNLKHANLIQNEIVHHFFALGGYQINISKWYASDDTILMIATKKACEKGGELNDFIDEYIKALPELEKNKRASGYTTLKSLRILSKSDDINKITYSKTMGGNGAAMRTSYIGLKYYKEEEVDILIEKSIQSSRLTHNYPLGFLGGLVTALFTSYAMRNIYPWKWNKLLIKLYESGKIDKFMKTTNIYSKYLKDKDEFWSLWYKYREYRLAKLELKPREFTFSADRLNDLLDYTPGVQLRHDKGDFSKFGSTGVGATIIAYDALLMSISSDSRILSLDEPEKIKYNWESLLYFSTLHFGDNDSTGTIAGAWYGALRGFESFNKQNIEQLEFKHEL
jgi:ADP-ribosylarginine hydrolase